jgi:V8-like Glu-specific endopeptidase
MIEPISPAEQLFFVTGRVQCKAAATAWSGTGFFVSIPVDDGSTKMIFVTNKHVLNGAQTVQIITPAASNESQPRPLFGQSAVVHVQSPTFATHSDPSVDVAAMVLDGQPILGQHQPYIKNLPVQMLTNETEVARLDAIEPITFIGYPNALFDQFNMTPIARRGWTATPISLDHNGKPCFLIDASVFKGSSGSPVFVLDTGSYSVKGGGLVIGGRIALLGIVAAVHLQATTGKLVPTAELPGVSVDQPINLGIAYKTCTILETIDSLLSGIGLKRAEAQTESTSVPVDPPEMGSTGTASNTDGARV